MSKYAFFNILKWLYELMCTIVIKLNWCTINLIKYCKISALIITTAMITCK